MGVHLDAPPGTILSLAHLPASYPHTRTVRTHAHPHSNTHSWGTAAGARANGESLSNVVGTLAEFHSKVGRRRRVFRVLAIIRPRTRTAGVGRRIAERFLRVIGQCCAASLSLQSSGSSDRAGPRWRPELGARRLADGCCWLANHGIGECPSRIGQARIMCSSHALWAGAASVGRPHGRR